MWFAIHCRKLLNYWNKILPIKSLLYFVVVLLHTNALIKVKKICGGFISNAKKTITTQYTIYIIYTVKYDIFLANFSHIELKIQQKWMILFSWIDLPVALQMENKNSFAYDEIVQTIVWSIYLFVKILVGKQYFISIFSSHNRCIWPNTQMCKKRARPTSSMQWSIIVQI